MPYIKNEDRPEIDKLLDPLIKCLQETPVEEQDGKVDYTITRILKSTYTKRFFNFNRAMGVLSSVTFEFYRRVVGPYEDEKIKENGDVK